MLPLLLVGTWSCYSGSDSRAAHGPALCVQLRRRTPICMFCVGLASKVALGMPAHVLAQLSVVTLTCCSGRASRAVRGTRVCAKAAWSGRLDVLQWLRANGCPWDVMVRSSARWKGHLHVLKWAVANGCP